MSKIPIRKTAGATARTVPAPVATIPMTQSSLLKPGNLAKFEETWAKIEPLVRRMFTEGGISKSEWQDIFWHVHSMCVWDISQGLALQEKLEEIFRAYIDKEKQFIFKERDNENPVALLRAYVDAWNRFLFYYNYVPLPFGPLEKLHYSSSSGSVGGGGGGAGLPKKLHNDVESGIRQTMIELWVEHIFSEIHSRLVEAAMLLIDGERHFNAPLSYSPWAATGGSANVLGNRRPSLLSPSSMLAPTTSTTTTAALSNVAAHRLIIGIKESCLYLGRFVNDHLFLYRVNYEMVYLVRTETYYRLAGQAFLQEYGILPYMQWVEGRIAEEQERVTTRGYLEEHSLSKVTDSIVKTLIVSVKEQLVEKFPGLLADGDIAMLSRLFSLLARVPPTAEGGEGGEGGVERRHSTTISSSSSSSSSNDLSGMVTAFREYLIGRGAKELKALEFSSCSRAAGAAAAAVPGTQPPPPRNLLLSSLVADSEAYIEQLLRLFNDATKLIKDAFGGDPRFLTARDMAFNKLINEKCGAYLCGGGGPSGASKMAEKMDVSENNNNNNNNPHHLKDAMVVEGDRADGSAEGGGESSLAATKSAAAAQQRGSRAPPPYSELGGGSRCAELFANYCDMLLRKGTTLSRGLTSDQIEAKLVNVILVLKYVQDRLLFIRLYKAHLTRRLLLDASVDLVCEEQMVGRLRDVGMPADALNSLGRMFSDLTVSEDFNRQFRAAQAKKEDESGDFGASQLVTVKVLNSKAWSTSVAGSGGGGGGGGAFGGVGSSTTSALMTAAGANNKPDGAAAATTTAASLTPSVSLPPGVEETLLKVAAFYREKHTSRRLIWHHQFSSGVITFHTDLGASYDLEATAYQAAVLFSWNDRSSEEGQRPEGEQQEDSPMMEQSSEGSSFAPSSSAVLSLEALSLATQLPAVELKRALWSLVSNPKLKTQLLLPANPDGQPLKHIRDITARTKFRLNDKFALLGKNGRLLKRARVNLIGRLALGSLGGAGASSSSSSSSSANYANVWADEAEAEKEAIARLRAERADEALLKILKTRKSSDQRALFAEATRLLSQALFVPSGALLTERLQWLLEHGSVRRDEADERLYHYA